MKMVMGAVALAVVCAGCFMSSYSVSQEDGSVRIVRSVEGNAWREAILKGAASRGWVLKSERPGCVTLVLDMRGGKHMAVVDVLYANDEFSVRYVDSSNLEYDRQTGRIHRKYVQWVRNLKKAIRAEASKIL